MQFFLSLLLATFYLLHTLIIIHDIQYKKILNKYLLISGIISIILAYYIWNIHSLFIINLACIIPISFLLYYFNFWSAGDAKYLIVLYLLLWNASVITFFWNIWITTIIYVFSMLLYNVLFWKAIRHAMYKCIKKRAQKQYIAPLKKLLQSPSIEDITSIINAINIFLSIFVLIRLIRIYVIEKIIPLLWIDLESITQIQIILIMTILIITTMIVVKKIWRYIGIISYERRNIQKQTIDTIWMILLFIGTSIFIWEEYMHNPEELIANMYNIFTIYILLFFIIRILIFFFQIVFIDLEKRSIHIKDLKSWDIIDTTFINEFIVPKVEEVSNRKISQKNKNIIKSITWIIEAEEVEILQKSYKYLDISNGITILNTFAFSPIIFWWFIITFYYWNTFFIYLIEKLFAII